MGINPKMNKFIFGFFPRWQALTAPQGIALQLLPCKVQLHQ